MVFLGCGPTAGPHPFILLSLLPLAHRSASSLLPLLFFLPPASHLLLLRCSLISPAPLLGTLSSRTHSLPAGSLSTSLSGATSLHLRRRSGIYYMFFEMSYKKPVFFFFFFLMAYLLACFLLFDF